MTYQLYSIPFSHYNEKVRWMLDILGVSYQQHACLPLFHIPIMLAARIPPGEAGNYHSPFATPVLLADNGEVIRESTHILQHLAQHKTTSNQLITQQALALDKKFTAELGPVVRIIAYYYLLQKPSLYRQVIRHNVASVQATLGVICSPLLIFALRRVLTINDTTNVSAIRSVKSLFDEVNALLGLQAFIAGDHFSIADISFAALSAPILGITDEQGYGAWLPDHKLFPAAFADLVEEYRTSRAGERALQMYREFRHKLIV